VDLGVILEYTLIWRSKRGPDGVHMVQMGSKWVHMEIYTSHYASVGVYITNHVMRWSDEDSQEVSKPSKTLQNR
jgi:hypothetical protein